MNFKIEKKLTEGLGRAGILETNHGVIETPAFVVVGTKATVKALTPEQVKEIGAQVILGNTYHLYLQPGEKIISKIGGINKFMNWSGPTMTDSGGFQVFSLGAAYGKDPEGKQSSYGAGISKIMKKNDLQNLIPERPALYQAKGFGSGFDDSDAPRLAKIGNDGVSFKSHLDGSIHYLTPEKSIQIQHALGADIIFAFDECTSPVEDFKYQNEALERTHAWAERSLREHIKLTSLKFSTPAPFADPGEVAVGPSGTENYNDAHFSKHAPALFGIVQGGREESLRKKSAKIISELNVHGRGFDGFGIGGSFAKEDMSSAVRWVNEILPEEKPRHLLGIGEPEDLFMGIENGVDLFDCVLPTRLGRNGTFYTNTGKINILNTKYQEDFLPIEKDCQCYVCKNYTKSYLAHLFRGEEMLAGTLGSMHNLYFIINLVKKIRQSILDNSFFSFKKEFLAGYLKEE